MSDEPLPNWYHQRWMSRALRGLPVELTQLDPEPDNVFSIELGRTQRAIRMLRGAAIKERPL